MQSAKMWSTTRVDSWTSSVFSIYINDLPLNVEDGQFVLFVYHINLLVIKRDENVLQYKVHKVMKQLEYWFQKNNLMINIGKTVAMSFNTKQSRILMRPKITCSNIDIAYKSDAKFLVIPIRENFKWVTHIRI